MRRLSPLPKARSISTVPSRHENIADAMETGGVDIAMGTLSDLHAGFFQRRLFRQHYVCMFRKGHPLDKPSITLYHKAIRQRSGSVSNARDSESSRAVLRV